MKQSFKIGLEVKVSKESQLESYEVYYKELQEAVSQIDSHFVKALDSHEQDFLKAYKIQMSKVEKELRFLKNKQIEQATKLMKDEDIINLQTSIAYFKTQALNLNSILN